MGLHHGPSLSGLYSGIAAPSAKHIKQFFPHFTSGNYWINDNGTPKEIYCDLETEGGGWILYSSFANDNPYDSTKPAWNGNRILYSQLATYGYSITSTYYSDGIVNIFSSYVRRPQFFGHFYPSTPNGLLNMSSWNGPNYGVSEMLVYHGKGSTNASFNGPSGNIITNNNTVVVGSSEDYTAISKVPFDPTGATPIFRQIEGVTSAGIAGISWIFVR